jgi:putative ABC transport system ATP-binding protein
MSSRRNLEAEKRRAEMETGDEMSVRESERNASSEALIVLQEVTKTYRNQELEVHAVSEVDLSIERGDFLVLAGPSGCGKTTLMNMIGALDVPTSGRLRFDGVQMDEMNAAELSALRLNKMGFVFQSYNLIPVLTAYENAEYVLLLRGVSAEVRKKKAEELLKAVGLYEHRNKRPGQLSGGQQQRVAIARALAGDPPLLIADEPTANLDSRASQELIELMHRMNRERGTTCIIGSHDPRVIDQADRLVRLLDGKVESDVLRESHLSAPEGARTSGTPAEIRP